MSFARRVSDHEQAHGQEPRETPPDFIDRAAQRRNSFHEILLHEENRLDAAHAAGGILEKEIMVHEIRAERVRDDFVKAMVLGFARKRESPRRLLAEIAPRKDPRDTIRKRNCFGNGHRWNSPPPKRFRSLSRPATRRSECGGRAADLESRSRPRAISLRSRN